MKIVVAVGEDKKTIVKRTGQCAYFAIYEDANLVEYIKNSHHGGGHHSHTHKHEHDASEEEHENHTNEHKKDVAQLRGNDVILVQAIGENMREALESVGLKIKKVRQKDGVFAQELVENFLKANLA
ncbi:MAG: hypothetical protein JXQ67_07095 [Campylobacterales bacterium]|nr:hypothetical protein [Campylobacterales bacterium]